MKFLTMKFLITLTCGVALLGVVTLTPAQSAQAAQSPVSLEHLDWLHTTVAYPEAAVAGHSALEPGVPLDAWWTYADYDAETDTYRAIGGGDYNAEADTWGQGAFNLDDVARAALVYLEHYELYGDPHSRDMAYGALRFVMYMQTQEGPEAGNFVLWMQPDGALNPSPTPPDDPNPADAAFSWWAARGMWALAAGYEVFKDEQPELAEALAARLELSMGALERLLQPDYGTYTDLHGYAVPAWFINGGADASSIALIALTTYYRASGDPQAARLAAPLADAIAQFQFGSPVTWPFEAHLPWAGSLSNWHAWGSRMMGALALAGDTFGRRDWIASAEREANHFMVHQLISTGPINGLLPAPNDLTQINYGNEVMVTNLLALSEATDKPAYSVLAGLQASWWEGNNRAGEPMVDRATGRGFDGLAEDGTINRNAGAESTIAAVYGLLRVVQDPVAVDYLEYAEPLEAVTWRKVEAEAGGFTGDAESATPEAAWTGEALWSGGQYARLGPGGTVSLSVELPSDGTYRLFMVYDKQPGAVAVRAQLGDAPPLTHFEGGAGGASYLWMDGLAVPGQMSAGPQTLTLTGLWGEARVDAVLLQPLVESRAMRRAPDGAEATLFKSFAEGPTSISVATANPLGDVTVFDRNGSVVRTETVTDGHAALTLPAFGYALLETHP